MLWCASTAAHSRLISLRCLGIILGTLIRRSLRNVYLECFPLLVHNPQVFPCFWFFPRQLQNFTWPKKCTDTRLAQSDPQPLPLSPPQTTSKTRLYRPLPTTRARRRLCFLTENEHRAKVNMVDAFTGISEEFSAASRRNLDTQAGPPQQWSTSAGVSIDKLVFRVWQVLAT